MLNPPPSIPNIEIEGDRSGAKRLKNASGPRLCLSTLLSLYVDIVTTQYPCIKLNHKIRNFKNKD